MKVKEPGRKRAAACTRGWFLLMGATCVCALLPARSAAAPKCAAPASMTQVTVPGHPFAALSSPDGCWLFVSLTVGKGHGAVAVLRNQGGHVALDHVVALDGPAYGEALSRDGKRLAVAAAHGVAWLDVGGLEQGAAEPILGTFRDSWNAGAVYVAIRPDDRLLAVSDEHANRISVFDLAGARGDALPSWKPLGRIPTAEAPVGLAFSPDGRWLYATSEVAPARSFPATCRSQGKNRRMHPVGVLFRIDARLAMRDPSHAVVAAFPAGCNPVRVAVSPSGSQVWVTARGSDGLLRFQAQDLLASATGAGYAMFSIGTSPVGVAVRPDGKQVWVALSDRFGTDAAGRLAGMAFRADDAATKLMSAPAAGFPREVAFLPDAHTIVATLFDARRIEFIATPP